MTTMTNREKIEAKRRGLAAERSKGIRPYKFNPGQTLFRILPQPVGDFERRFGKTYLKSFDNSQYLGIGDRDITYGERDVVRELLYDAMRQAPDQATKDHYYSMIAYPRYVICGQILNDPKQPINDPVILDIGGAMLDSIWSQMAAWQHDDPNYDPTSLTTNHVFQMDRVGSGKTDTKYTVTITPQHKPVSPDLLAKVIDLDAYIAGQFENLEQKAIEFVSRLNAQVGITVNANLLTGPVATPANTSAGLSDAAVTAVLDDDAEETAYEPVAEAKPAVAAKPAAAKTPAKVAEPEPEPAPAAAVATATADLESIDDILSSLDY